MEFWGTTCVCKNNNQLLVKVVIAYLLPFYFS